MCELCYMSRRIYFCYGGSSNSGKYLPFYLIKPASVQPYSVCLLNYLPCNDPPPPPTPTPVQFAPLGLAAHIRIVAHASLIGIRLPERRPPGHGRQNEAENVSSREDENNPGYTIHSPWAFLNVTSRPDYMAPLLT